MLPLFYKHPFHHWILRPLRVVVFFCFLFFSCQTCSLYSPLIHTHSLSNSSHIWVLAHFWLSFLFEHCTVTGFVISRFLQFFIFSLSYIHLGVPSYSINKLERVKIILLCGVQKEYRKKEFASLLLITSLLLIKDRFIVR